MQSPKQLARIARRVTNVGLGLMLGCAVIATRAETIYRWVDEAGETHVSDVVPERYRGVARRIDSTRFDVAPAESAAAKQRAAALKAEADAIAAQPTPAVPAKRRTSAAVTAAKASSPADRLDCAAWRRKFNASRDCFAGYMLGDGSLRPGAFQACGEDVKDPTPTCGPENW